MVDGAWSVHSAKPPQSPEQLYASRPPWDIDRPQPAICAVAQAGEIRGRVLDVGCGTGEHAMLAASLGLEATGVDLAGIALERAREKARERGLTVRFLQHDARRLAELGDAYDTVIDCGLFHIFSDDDRVTYVESLRSVLISDGRYFMLGFSDRQPGDWGPRRLTREEIVSSFASGWRIDSLERATIDVNMEPGSMHAWLLAATRA